MTELIASIVFVSLVVCACVSVVIVNLKSQIRYLKQNNKEQIDAKYWFDLYLAVCKDLDNLRLDLKESISNREHKAKRINELMEKQQNDYLLNKGLMIRNSQLKQQNNNLINRNAEIQQQNDALGKDINLYIEEIAEFRKVKEGCNYFAKDVNGKMKLVDNMTKFSIGIPYDKNKLNIADIFDYKYKCGTKSELDYIKPYFIEYKSIKGKKSKTKKRK